MVCSVCGKVIKNKRNKKFCSRKCAGLYRQNYAICPICGKKFKHSPSDVMTKTCGSDKCKLKCRDRNILIENIKHAHEKIKENPNTGHFETHHAAAEWKIVSPSGEVYEFKNLILWAEKNAALLPVSLRTGERVQPRTFVREITRLKSEHEKHACLRNNYYGWKVIEADKGSKDGEGK